MQDAHCLFHSKPHPGRAGVSRQWSHCVNFVRFESSAEMVSVGCVQKESEKSNSQIL
jgi:hypothetical protein